MSKKRIIVIEDGREYEEFARLFLSDRCEIDAAHSASEALTLLRDDKADAFLIDLRFDRSRETDLVGDPEETARRLFAGDRSSAIAYLQDHQGALILAELRRAGHFQPAVFVHDFAPQRLRNLCRLYGKVLAVPSFDAKRIRDALGIDS